MYRLQQAFFPLRRKSSSTLYFKVTINIVGEILNKSCSDVDPNKSGSQTFSDGEYYGFFVWMPWTDGFGEVDVVELFEPTLIYFTQFQQDTMSYTYSYVDIHLREVGAASL